MAPPSLWSAYWPIASDTGGRATATVASGSWGAVSGSVTGGGRESISAAPHDGQKAASGGAA